MDFAFLIIAALAIPVLGLVGFFRSLSLGKRVGVLEARLRFVEARLAMGVDVSGQTAPQPQAGSAPSETPPDQEPSAPDATPEINGQEEVSGTPGPAAEPPQGVETPPEGMAVPEAEPLRPAARTQSFEELIGTRWAVWLGGLALGLGGLFLVRYSIEQGWFGPGARIAAGLLFATALLAVGEWMRRREMPQETLAGIPQAHIPSVLTAAGTLTAFGTVYAAHALYDMIGPATAFVLLGAIGIATMAAAALHGPALAGFGLIGSFAAPVLVSSNNPQPWPVLFYLLVVAASAYSLANLRGWLWLALATASGAALWCAAFIFAVHGEEGAVMTQIALQAALAAIAFGLLPYRHMADDEKPTYDIPALAVLGAFALLAIVEFGDGRLGAGRPVLAGVMLAILLGTALVSTPVAGAGLMGAAVAAAALALWPVAREAAAEGARVLPGAVANPPLPDAVFTFIVVALLSGGALAAAGMARLARSPRLASLPAGLYAGAAVVGPLALLVVSWWRISDFDRSIPFGLVAAMVALGFTGATMMLRPRALEDNALPAWLGFEAFAAGALAALALGLTMVLDRSSLTVALALAALGAAWVTTRQPLGLLRYAIGVTGVIVLGRLIWSTTLYAGDIGTTPIFNWLLWSYGVPALAFGATAWLLQRQKDDEVVALCEGLTIALTAFLFVFEIRHAVTGSVAPGRPSHLEVGLQVFAGLVFAIVLVRLEAVRRSKVLLYGSYVLGGLSLAGGVAGLAFGVNPLLARGEPILGGAIFNSLLLAYLAPALAAFALARIARERRPVVFVQAAAALGALLQFLWTVMEIRHLFQGRLIGLARSTSDAEFYTYSAVFIVIGLVLLVFGILRGSRVARLVSAAYILLAVVKVFLFDMQGLTGAYRALSFIGLGIVLVGIGLAYQKWVFARPVPAPGPVANPEPPEPT